MAEQQNLQGKALMDAAGVTEEDFLEFLAAMIVVQTTLVTGARALPECTTVFLRIYDKIKPYIVTPPEIAEVVTRLREHTKLAEAAERTH